MLDVVAWLGQLPPALVYVVTGALVLAETGLVIGLVLPGEVTLIAVGFLASLGTVDPYAAAVGLIAAALAGDALAFAEGVRYGPRLRASRAGQWVGDERWAKAEALLQRHGGRAVTVGRYVPFARTLLPRLCAIGGMPYRHFVGWDAVGVVTQVGSGVLIGYLAGGSYQLATQVLGRATGAVLLLALVMVGLVVFGLLLWSRKLRDWGRPRLFVSRWHIALLLYLSMSLCMTTMWTNRGIVNEIKQAERMGILNYEVYMMLSSMKKETIDPATVTPQAIRQLKKLPETESVNLRGAAEGRNTIVIQLESFQAWLIGLTIDGKAVTPVMNELVRQGLYFPHIYQQVGQGNTSDAEFVMNTSFYVPPNGAASQVYSDKILPSR